MSLRTESQPLIPPRFCRCRAFPTIRALTLVNPRAERYGLSNSATKVSSVSPSTCTSRRVIVNNCWDDHQSHFFPIADLGCSPAAMKSANRARDASAELSPSPDQPQEHPLARNDPRAVRTALTKSPALLRKPV